MFIRYNSYKIENKGFVCLKLKIIKEMTTKY
jgi:hypothetical protein